MTFLRFVALCVTCFGFAPTFWVAVFFRFLWGLLNGNIGVAKTYLAEISDDTNSAKAMALFGVIGGFGRTIGPVIGGFLSQPAQLYPKTFSHTIFATYPFALPSLVICINCLFVLLISYCYLAETLPTKVITSPPPSALGTSHPSPVQYALLNSSEEEGDESSFELTPEKKNNKKPTNNQKDNKAIELQKIRSPLHFGSGSNNNGNMVILDKENQSFDEESGSEEVKNVLIPFQIVKAAQDGNNNNNNISPLRKNTSVGGSGRKNKDGSNRQSRRLTFSGVVQVKVIGSDALAYSSLKNIKETDEPIIDFSNDDNDNNGKNDNDLNNSNNNEVDEETGLNTSFDNQNSSRSDRSDRSPPKSPIILRYSNGSEEYFDPSTGDPSGATFNAAQRSGPFAVLNKISYLLNRKEILISTLLYGTNALTMIATNEIFPLWVVTPKSLGGFEFTSDKIGISTMCCGVIAVILQLFFYPKLVEWIGTLRTYRWCTLMYALGAALTPLVSLVNETTSPWVMWTSIIGSQLLLTVPASFVLVTVFVFINNSCYSQDRATVNGIGQTFASLGRLLGPYSAARIFAWSETNHLKWPTNFYFVFYLIALITLMNWYLGMFLPRSIERRKREPKNGDFMKRIGELPSARK
jgi:MFS family permease